MKSLATNRKANYDYFIEDKIETGIVLTGTEVKSIRSGRLNLVDSYATIENGEVFIVNMHISPYDQGNIQNVNPLRKRKLLLHKKEISKLLGYTSQKGYSLIPLSVYLSKGKVKISLATAKGKKNYDKRQSLKEKDDKRKIERTIRGEER